MKFEKGSVRRSLRYSIVDGLFAAMMIGVSDFYLIPYGIALGATPGQVAMIGSIPLLAGALLQTKSASVTQSIGSRLKLINILVFFHALAWLPIIFVPYIYTGALKSHAPTALLASVTIYASVGAFSVPAWQSLMSDYIPTRKRGQYFGWRNRLQGTMTILVSILAGLVLHHYGRESLTGFTLVFSFAMVCRFVCWFCLTRMREPFRKAAHDVYFSFYAFLRQIRTSNFAKFVLFASLTMFAVHISASLFSVFLLQGLGFDYASYMLIVTTAAASGVIFQPIWGRYGDRLGNLRVLNIAGWGISILPGLWLISQDIRFGIAIQLIAGCFWGGFTLLVNNFIMEAVTPEKRIRCISYFNVMNNLALLAGASLGGYLIHHLPPLGGYSFLTLFLISCVSRVIVMTFIAPSVKEVRRV